jgi:DNA-binding MarR family transcriptional regulator
MNPSKPAPPAAPAVKEKIDLESHLPYRLNYVASITALGVTRFLSARFGIGIREWRVLAILGYYGTASAADMVGSAAFDKATVSRAVSVLEKKGLIKKTVDPAMKRRRLISLTPAGARLHDRIVPLVRMRRRNIEAALSEEERAALSIILDKLKLQVERLLREEEEDRL